MDIYELIRQHKPAAVRVVTPTAAETVPAPATKKRWESLSRTVSSMRAVALRYELLDVQGHIVAAEEGEASHLAKDATQFDLALSFARGALDLQAEQWEPMMRATRAVMEQCTAMVRQLGEMNQQLLERNAQLLERRDEEEDTSELKEVVGVAREFLDVAKTNSERAMREKLQEMARAMARKMVASQTQGSAIENKSQEG